LALTSVRRDILPLLHSTL